MKKTLRRVVLGFSVLATALAVFARVDRVDAQTAPESWQIELDMFSGLPNPVFTVTAAELTQVKDRLGRARVMAGANSAMTSIRPPILGYRGLIIRGKSADLKQVMADAEVSHGKILRKGPGARALLDDSASGLESLLVSLAASRQLIPSPMMTEIRKVVP